MANSDWASEAFGPLHPRPSTFEATTLDVFEGVRPDGRYHEVIFVLHGTSHEVLEYASLN